MTDVVVIGAGPYGLSVAANLLRANLQIRVFGRTMEMWKELMPNGMVLKSDAFASNFGAMPLTLEQFCRTNGRPYRPVGYRIPMVDLVGYAEAFQASYVPHIEDVRVTSVAPTRGGYVVQLDNDNEVFTRHVVVATGLMGLQRMPTIAGMPEDRITHVSAHHDLSGFQGRRVLVLGAGQSAFEFAHLLNEAQAKVDILTRRPPVWFSPDSEVVPSTWKRFRHPNFGLGPGWRTWLWSEAPNVFYQLPESFRVAKAYSTFGPAGSGWLRNRVVGNIPLATGAVRHARMAGDAVQVTADVDGQPHVFEVDHVVAATGYEANMRRLKFLQPVLSGIRMLADGIPDLDRSYQTSLPGLHIVGFLSAASWGPSMRFIYGTNFAGPHIAGVIKRGATRSTVTAPGFLKARAA